MSLSTAQAAGVVGVTPAGFRSAMTQARRTGWDARVPGPDARTPMWDEATLQAWMTTRPGRSKRPVSDHANVSEETP